MVLNENEMLSAQVVLKSASGKTYDGTTEITTENIQDFLPSDDAVAKSMEVFSLAGFQLGTLVGNSFSISAEVGSFERTFNVQLRRQANGDVEVIRDDGSSSHELPLAGVPGSISALIETVTFTPPPDFGPTNFGP